MYTCLAGMPTLRSAVTIKVDSSPQRPFTLLYTVMGDAVLISDAWYVACSAHQ